MNQDTGWEGGLRVPAENISEAQYCDRVRQIINNPELEQLLSELVESESQKAVWEAVTRFAQEIHSFKKFPLLTVDCFCFAAGMFALEGLSETDLAKRHHVSKKLVSKRVVQITKSLGLPPSRGMKRENAREIYSKIRRETHENRHTT